MFDINQYVRLVENDPEDVFYMSEGIIEDVTVDRNHDTIYGVKVMKYANEVLSNMDEEMLVYFKGHELSLVKGE